MKNHTTARPAHLALAAAAALALATAPLGAADKVQLEGAEVGVWTMDFDAATKLAKAKGLPVMLNFTGSDWCGWCKLMDKEVFAQEAWKKYAAENAVLVTLDFPRDKSIVPVAFTGRNTELRDRFGVSGYPTYVVVDSDGKTELGRLGAGKGKTPASFIEEFKGVTRLSAANIAAYTKANPDKAEAYQKAIEESRAAKKALDDWIATRPQRNDENNQKFEAFKDRIMKAEEALKAF